MAYHIKMALISGLEIQDIHTQINNSKLFTLHDSIFRWLSADVMSECQSYLTSLISRFQEDERWQYIPCRDNTLVLG